MVFQLEGRQTSNLSICSQLRIGIQIKHLYLKSLCHVMNKNRESFTLKSKYCKFFHVAFGLHYLYLLVSMIIFIKHVRSLCQVASILTLAFKQKKKHLNTPISN